MFRILLRAALCVALASVPAFAATAAVGTCLPQYTSFATITAAINSVPASSTIFVCPGSYPEQITINKRLTLKGANNGATGAAIITAPAGGIVANSTSLVDSSPIAAQILIDGSTLANISFITVDGSNNNISGCGPNLVGVYYRNSSGTITKTSELNQALTPTSLNGCQSGLGIFVESGGGHSTVTISGNYVHNYQKNGITGNEAGTTVTISGNTVIGQGSTTGAAENSIQIGFGAAGAITTNIVGDDIWAPDTVTDPGDAAAGILVYGSPNINVSSNTVNSTQFGIAISSDSFDGLPGDNATVKLNKISTSQIFDGIDLCSNYNSATSNVVTGSDEAGIHLDDTCTGTSTGNSVSANTINTACTGILLGPGTPGNSIGTNTIINTLNLMITGTNSCTPPGLAALHRMHAHPRGFRP